MVMEIGPKKMTKEGEERLDQSMKNAWHKTWEFQL
jgi:hypothetical protein